MISVIVSLYNVEKYITNCLKSIVNQDYANFELVIVDDGSIDNSVKIADDYLKDKNIKYKIIEKENGGQSSSRNAGLKNSNGEYIVFMDSDDVVSSDFLSSLKNAIDKNGVDFSFCNFKFVKEQVPPNDNNTETVIYDKENLLNVFLKRNINFVVPSMMFKKSFLINNNVTFDERINYSEDQMFIWDAIMHSNKSIYLYKKMYGYYIREKSIMTSSPYKRISSAHIVYKQFCEKLIKDYPQYQNIVKYILPRWEIGTLYTSAKLVNEEEYKDLYNKFNGKTIFNRLIGIGELKAYLLSFVAKSPVLLNKLCKVMDLNA